MADEEGYISVIDTSRKLPYSTALEPGQPGPSAQWLAHRNAIFDIAWCKVGLLMSHCCIIACKRSWPIGNE